MAGVQYSATCTASGGIAPYSWSISSGTLPSDLTLTPSADTTMATISGIPAVSGSYSYTVEVTDSTPVIPMTATQAYSGAVAPNVTSLSPTSVNAGNAAFTLTVNGNGFGNDTVVSFNGNALSTAFVSSVQVTATVPANLVATANTVPVTVTSGGATSNSASFVIKPTLTSLSPNSVTAGSAAFTLTANGSGFGSWRSRELQWHEFLDHTCQFQPGNRDGPGHPGCDAKHSTGHCDLGGISSNSVNFAVNSPSTLTSLSPNSTTAGSAAFTLTVNGSNFGNGSVVSFGGTNLTTTFVNANQVTAMVPASLVVTPHTVQVGVTTGGVSSNFLSFMSTSPRDGHDSCFIAQSEPNSGKR